MEVKSTATAELSKWTKKKKAVETFDIEAEAKTLVCVRTNEEYSLQLTYFLMMEFRIDSPSSKSASLAMNSNLVPVSSTPTKSLCSAGKINKNSHNR